MEIKKNNLTVLVIMDGWGIAPAGPGNAISLAKTPNFDHFWRHYPHTQLKASGEAVGRRLDFITQEMLREANTIGSKSANAEIIRRVIDIKCAVDRLKEQVQNVE